MKRSLKHALIGLTAGTLAAAAIVVPAVPASAHEAPKPGTTCAMSGTVEYNHGTVFVCTSRTEGAKPRWGSGQKVTKSGITIADGWAKAAKSGMSAAFGMIRNPTGTPVRVVGATSPYAKVVQLHEVVDKDGSMVMQQKAGGFVIPAGGMVPITLITAEGGIMRTTVMAKVYKGANESYDGGMSGM